MVDFWAKTTRDNRPGISVFEHMVNVGCVARFMVKDVSELLNLFQLEQSVVGALAALHDLGKISPGFQRKCKTWLEERELLEIARNGVWDTALESDHGKVTHAAVQKFLDNNGVDQRTSKFLSAVLGGHHGRFSPPNDRGFTPRKAITEQRSGIEWENERNNAADAIMSQFEVELKGLVIDDASPALWWLAGLTSVADWIGSDEHHFPVEGGLRYPKAVEVAGRCLNEIGCVRSQIVRGLSFHDLFHDSQKPNMQFTPNKIQSAALSTITDRGVYVIEAPMGMGKTEAALGSAYNLLVSGKARGIYFALPTQATSNRMHLRMAEFVKRIVLDSVGSKIIHGNSWLFDQKFILSPVPTAQGVAENADIGRDWFSSAKRALLAPFGVGTVDQALLGVVAAKHFFVRHFALAGKVVILDEIHSYDLYTGTLIDRLIETLEDLGCTIIVLSATLSRKRRGQIISNPEDNITNAAKEPYPLLTGRRERSVIKPVAVELSDTRDIEISFKSDIDATADAIETARKGGCVLWVCDTVDSAQRVYCHLTKLINFNFPIGLLHSRFPFWRREELEEEWMNRLGKNNSTRCGSILVSTQIVEQSVDLDADYLITELAPTDMLLQRLGRLWRHERGSRPLPKPLMFIIEEQNDLAELKKFEPKAIIKSLGGKAYVYNPYVLLRSLEVWKKHKRVKIPDQIRSLIETTYKQRVREPKAWQKLSDDWFATDSGKKFLAARNSNLWQVALEDEEGVQTRLNELPHLSLVLCRYMTEEEVRFINETTCTLGGEEFQLTTAQGIHSNLVRIPDYHFERTYANPLITRYLRGRQCVGLVQSDGFIAVRDLKKGIVLRWDIRLGVVIEKKEGKEDQ